MKVGGFMDGILIYDATAIYSVILAPLLAMILLFCWTAASMKKIAKFQLLGIVLLFALGFLAINSPIILIVEAVAIILLVVWIFNYRASFHQGQILVVLLVIVMHIIYAILFFALAGLENSLGIVALCIFPVLSMMLLYPWTFGDKKLPKGRVFILILLVVQMIFVILNIVLPLNT